MARLRLRRGKTPAIVFLATAFFTGFAAFLAADFFFAAGFAILLAEDFLVAAFATFFADGFILSPVAVPPAFNVLLGAHPCDKRTPLRRRAIMRSVFHCKASRPTWSQSGFTVLFDGIPYPYLILDLILPQPHVRE